MYYISLAAYRPFDRKFVSEKFLKYESEDTTTLQGSI
jgi:hypothetical protein